MSVRDLAPDATLSNDSDRPADGWLNVGNANDGNGGTYAYVDSFVSGGPATFRLVAHLDLAYVLSELTIVDPTYSPAPTDGYTVEVSDDGSSWTSTPATQSAVTIGGQGGTSLVLDDEPEASWVRLSFTHAGGFFFNRRITTWAILGDDVPDDGPSPPSPPDVIHPMPPAHAILEIYVGDPLGARWDEALWDVDTWAGSGWVDVTPQGVFAVVSWGVDRPERGILADTVAGTWEVATFDPERILDPSNADSPYVGFLVPGLPIRLSHRSRIIRTGIVQTMRYTFSSGTGRIRATDKVALAAQATVPADTILSDTLHQRARDAIAAGGIDLAVEPTPGGTPIPLSPAPEGEASVWSVIADAAREVHYLPYLDENAMLRFARYSRPLYQGAEITGARLEDLEVEVSDDALVSVVRATDPDDGDIERRITPLPRYGEHVYSRDGTTINADAWAEAILVDRGSAALQWTAGRIRSETADEVEYAARRRINEVLTILVAEQSPTVEVRARILGARVRVEDFGRYGGPTWEWYFQTVTAAAEPLVDDDDGFTVLVDDDDGVTPLYPDGVVTTDA